jgi:hypothetical protein
LRTPTGNRIARPPAASAAAARERARLGIGARTIQSSSGSTRSIAFSRVNVSRPSAAPAATQRRMVMAVGGFETSHSNRTVKNVTNDDFSSRPSRKMAGG